jgi:hypothetical protein
MQEVSTVPPSLISEVMAWLEARGSVPTDPPFFCYRVIDMARELEIDVGVPAAIPLTGDQRMATMSYPQVVRHPYPHRALRPIDRSQQSAAGVGKMQWNRVAEIGRRARIGVGVALGDLSYESRN